jgi:hypothetical protein
MSKLLLKNLLLALWVFLTSLFGIYYITQDFSDTIIVFILLWAFIYYLIESKVKDLSFIDINLSVKGVSELIEKQEKDKAGIEGNGFCFFDAFMTNSSATITCYAYISKDSDMIYMNYHLKNYHIFEFGSKFEKEISLTTSNTVTVSLRPPNKLIQIFPKADYDLLLEKHKNAVNYLISSGLKPVKTEKDNFRQKITDQLFSIAKYQKRIPMFSLIRMIYDPLRYKKLADKTIEEQVKQGIINIKTLNL